MSKDSREDTQPTEVKKHPDFPEWIKSKDGEDCMQWPITEPKYLQNRLFWAFDAGRNCVWQQYMEHKSENAKLKEALSQLIEILEDVKYVGFNNLPARLYNEYKALIDSAKKLLTEEPLNQPHHEKEHKGQ